MLEKLAALPTIDKVYVLADKADEPRENKFDKIEVREDDNVSIMKILRLSALRRSEPS